MFIQVKLETVEEEEIAQGTSGTVSATGPGPVNLCNRNVFTNSKYRLPL